METLEEKYSQVAIVRKVLRKMMDDWMNDGNAVKIGEDTYIEQTTQWRKKFTKKELTRFFVEEYL